jgi:hypothetical protein
MSSIRAIPPVVGAIHELPLPLVYLNVLSKQTKSRLCDLFYRYFGI